LAATSIRDLSRVRAFGETAKKPGAKTLRKDHEQGGAMANNHWHPHTCPMAGAFKASPRHPAQGAAARLLHAIVRWQIRRLERRLASLELDERCLN
jgi:hypothetical protein